MSDDTAPRRRRSDPRIDGLEQTTKKLGEDHAVLRAKVDDLTTTTVLMDGKVDQNTTTLLLLETRTEPLQAIADGVKGLVMFGKVVVWLGGLAGSATAIYVFASGGGG